MRKLSIMLCIIIPLLIFSSCSNNPYSGNYTYNKDNNLNLVLNDNYTFTLCQIFDKYENSYNGKYTISNNAIKLTFNDVNVFHSINKVLKGKVQGSRITFKNVDSYFNKSN